MRLDPSRLGPVYFVTDAGAPASVEAQARAAIAAGVRMIQLRDKDASDGAFERLSRALLALTRAAGATLVINDRARIAVRIGAGGLHVGQGDGDIAAIRAQIGPDMILGLSVEADAQLAAIPADCADYLGTGPLRATATKPDAAQPLGMDGMARLIAAAPLPCVAIGGIALADVASLRRAGAAGIAVVSAVSRAGDMEGAARSLMDAWRRA